MPMYVPDRICRNGLSRWFRFMTCKWQYAVNTDRCSLERRGWANTINRGNLRHLIRTGSSPGTFSISTTAQSANNRRTIGMVVTKSFWILFRTLITESRGCGRPATSHPGSPFKGGDLPRSGTVVDPNDDVWP